MLATRLGLDWEAWPPGIQHEPPPGVAEPPSTAAAGAALWLARRSSCASPAVGVVMGQGQGGDTSVILAAAGKAATQLVESAQN